MVYLVLVFISDRLFVELTVIKLQFHGHISSPISQWIGRSVLFWAIELSFTNDFFHVSNFQYENFQDALTEIQESAVDLCLIGASCHSRYTFGGSSPVTYTGKNNNFQLDFQRTTFSISKSIFNGQLNIFTTRLKSKISTRQVAIIC